MCVRACVFVRVCMCARLSGAFDSLLSNCPEANVLTPCPGSRGAPGTPRPIFLTGFGATDGLWTQVCGSLYLEAWKTAVLTSFQVHHKVKKGSCSRLVSVHLDFPVLARRIYTFLSTAFEAKSSALRAGLLYKQGNEDCFSNCLTKSPALPKPFPGSLLPTKMSPALELQGFGLENLKET